MDRWDVRDRTLALALTELEDTSTPFGNDSARALDPRSEGEFEVRTVVDQEQLVIDQWHHENEKPGPGVRPYVVWVGGSVPDLQVDDSAQCLPSELDAAAVADLD